MEEIKCPRCGFVIKPNNNISSDVVDRIYRLYPTRCPIRGAATGKSHIHKKKIRKLLSHYTENELSSLISRYVEDCTNKKVYLMHFQTFLNRPPDPEQFEEKQTKWI
jgi:hypothetical protein